VRSSATRSQYVTRLGIANARCHGRFGGPVDPTTTIGQLIRDRATFDISVSRASSRRLAYLAHVTMPCR
jgi:hypothetical protein